MHGPKAWRGADLANDTSWIVTLSPAEIADLDQALKTARVSGRPLGEIDREHFPLTVRRPRWPRCTTAAAFSCCGACRWRATATTTSG
jgi:hypothetical protein